MQIREEDEEEEEIAKWFHFPPNPINLTPDDFSNRVG